MMQHQDTALRRPDRYVSDSPRKQQQVAFVDRWLTRKLLAAIGNPPVTFRLWNGENITPRGLKPEAVLKINSRHAILGLCLDPKFNFGELYASREIDVEKNLPGFLKTIYSSIHFKPETRFSRFIDRLIHRRSGNDMSRSRRNIYHHYDVGNEFYRQWLDNAAMQYTCAYFPEPHLTLEQAQTAKMHHICRKLQLAPGNTVVEAGSGWGGLALFMAREYGARVRSFNISHEQVIYAREQAKNAGLANMVEYIEDDYRNVDQTCDRFVSVGMLEHVGIQNYRELGNVIDRSLDKHGFGLIHTIGRDKPCSLNPWIEARIFPGANPPSLGQMMNIFEPYQLSILDIENLRLHYALTLQHWLERYESKVDLLKQRYDDKFIRTWQLYLAGSVAAFQAGTMQLFQVSFTRSRNNRLKWSRSHLYEPIPG